MRVCLKKYEKILRMRSSDRQHIENLFLAIDILNRDLQEQHKLTIRLFECSHSQLLHISREVQADNEHGSSRERPAQ